MSKVKTTTDFTKRVWYKSAVLPWAIIGITLIASGSFIAGWHLNQAHENNLRAEVSQRAESIVQVKEQL